MRPRHGIVARALAPFFLCGVLTSFACGGTDYVRATNEGNDLNPSGDWLEAGPGATDRGEGVAAPRGRRSAEPFRNTYYDFPSEQSGEKNANVYDAQCGLIARVTREFHDQVCVQGSGRLAAGETISFAKRDCSCAAECPRTGHRICFEKLDPKLFPTGRGSMGKPVTPLRSIAVDPELVPMGSVVYIPEYDGVPRPDGSKHDGCFLAEDRGSKVIGRHIDVFTGDPSTTRTWNQLVPSNEGVHVELDAPKCSHLKLEKPPKPGGQ